MQFSYEYPVFCERLVLVDSGGLGPEVHPLLRAATLPGAELVLPLIAHPPGRARPPCRGIAIHATGQSRRRTEHELWGPNVACFYGL